MSCKVQFALEGRKQYFCLRSKFCSQFLFVLFFCMHVWILYNAISFFFPSIIGIIMELEGKIIAVSYIHGEISANHSNGIEMKLCESIDTFDSIHFFFLAPFLIISFAAWHFFCLVLLELFFIQSMSINYSGNIASNMNASLVVSVTSCR